MRRIHVRLCGEVRMKSNTHESALARLRYLRDLARRGTLTGGRIDPRDASSALADPQWAVRSPRHIPRRDEARDHGFNLESFDVRRDYLFLRAGERRRADGSQKRAETA